MNDRAPRNVVSAAAIAGGMLLLGCTPTATVAGRSSIPATYHLGTLTAELGPEVSPMTIAAAAEGALRSRGYTVTKREVHEDRAALEAQPAHADFFNRIHIDSRPTSRGTSVAVHVDPFGDEAISYAVMDDLLARLGR